MSIQLLAFLIAASVQSGRFAHGRNASLAICYRRIPPQRQRTGQLALRVLTVYRNTKVLLGKNGKHKSYQYTAFIRLTTRSEELPCPLELSASAVLSCPLSSCPQRRSTMTPALAGILPAVREWRY